MQISQEDHERIAKAVAGAEKGTSGEIRCVLAQTTRTDSAAPALIAAALALIAPPIALALGLDPEALSAVLGQWSVGHLAAAQVRIASTLTVYVGLQAVIFAVVFGLASLTAVRRLLTPARVVKARVHDAAVLQFEALGLANTRDRTGILLFASLEDHRAEVLADKGIYDAAPHAVWDEVVAALVEGLRRDAPADGFVAAVERTGQVLAAALPPRADDANELPDGLIQTGKPKKRR